MKILKPLFLLFSVTFLFSCSTSRQLAQTKAPEIKNVILMIGDGMGLPHVYAAMTTAGAPLNLERCTTTGFHKTYSTDNYITDSAAGGTALSSGTKTNNGAIGVDASGAPVRTILEMAEAKGLATGLVSTSAITHATPASFIAHQSSRGSYEAIALDFLKTDVDCFIGGGIAHFAHRKDKLNLLDSLTKRGYDVDTTLSGILNSKSSKIAGLTAKEHNPYRKQGRGDMLPLSSEKAINLLSKNNKGFFLMIEGSEIDFAGHANQAEFMIDEVLDFDKAIGKAIDFAAKDGHTLVVITADHETGGVTITGGNLKEGKAELKFSTKDHTAVMVPVYAYGPGASSFSGIYENTDVFKKIAALMKMKN